LPLKEFAQGDLQSRELTYSSYGASNLATPAIVAAGPPSQVIGQARHEAARR
jgi:hypothetical protein